jgi:hypothetical protein
VSRSAALEIVATGEGSLLIGAVSLMPADNIRGWRADSMAARHDAAGALHHQAQHVRRRDASGAPLRPGSSTRRCSPIST